MRLRKVPALDGLRGIAVLLVVAVHTTRILVPSLTRAWLPGGFLGVDLFFVLSGFLITALLLNEQATGPIRMGAFYRRRALRILPALPSRPRPSCSAPCRTYGRARGCSSGDLSWRSDTSRTGSISGTCRCLRGSPGTETRPAPVRVGVAYAVAAALTLRSWHVVERPFLRWKRSLESRPAELEAPIAPTPTDVIAT